MTTLAHHHAGLRNASPLDSWLGVLHLMMLRYMDVLESVFLLRLLPPNPLNMGMRLSKSSKVYLQDCGLLLYLIDNSSTGELASHPSRGAI